MFMQWKGFTILMHICLYVRKCYRYWTTFTLLQILQHWMEIILMLFNMCRDFKTSLRKCKYSCATYYWPKHKCNQSKIRVWASRLAHFFGSFCTCAYEKKKLFFFLFDQMLTWSMYSALQFKRKNTSWFYNLMIISTENNFDFSI